MADDETPPEEPEYVIQSAVEWRQRRAKQSAKPAEKKGNGHDPVEPLPTVVAATLAGKQKPRQFLDSGHFFPQVNVILVQGDGGVGKSLLMMMLAIACVTGTKWLGLEVAQGPVIYFSAEDDLEELTRRLNEVCEAEGIDPAETYQLHFVPMAGSDAVLAVEKDGKLQPTPLYRQLEATIAGIEPVSVIVDNLANTFAGNENDRSHANHFISALRGLCVRHDSTVFLIGHPSLAGMASGTGSSGSTGWGNTVRARGYLYRPPGPDVDPDDRVFEIMKANYAASGTKLFLKWAKGRFCRCEPVNPLDAMASAEDFDKVEAQFRTRRWRVSEQSEDWGGYCVAEIIGLDVGRNLGADDRSPEQNKNRQTVRRLLSIWTHAKTIGIVKADGPQRKKVQFYSERQEDHG